MNVLILKMLLYYHKEKLFRMCIIQCAVSLFCTDSHGELDCACVWACVKKRDPERLLIVCMWYSTLCQPPSHFSTHIHTSSSASGNSPLIRENWGRASLIFFDGKESIQTPVTPTIPLFTQTEGWRILSLFFSFRLAPSFVFLSPFSLCFHVLLTKGWLECFPSSSH